MFHFETADIAQDLRNWLTEAGIPIRTYQRLEFLFRQVMMLSPCVEADYSHHETTFDFTNTGDLVSEVDRALAAWAKRYSDRDYGFEQIKYSAKPGRNKARQTYRQALLKFGEIFAQLPQIHLEDEWLNELARSLRFHESTDTNALPAPMTETGYYLGLAEGFFRPFFEAHFENRQSTSEKLYEFLAIKMSLEAGRPLSPVASSPKVETAHLRAVSREVSRLQVLPLNWPRLFTSVHNMEAA